MGTRHLIAVVKNGAPRVAQYCQWDGYPSGTGLELLAFLSTIYSNAVPGLAETFAAKVDNCRFIEPTEAQFKASPWMSRDTGADILKVVFESEGPLNLRDSWAFAGEGLFCEWAYVVDLDQGTFEVYEGFKRTDPPEGERFAKHTRDGDYAPVHLAKTYRLDALPTPEGFVSDLCSEDEEEAA